MTIARRLLATAGAAAFVLPAPVGFVVTAAPDGGWPGSVCSMGRAVQYNGTVFLGYVDSSGNVEARTIDDATGAVSAATTLKAALEVDWHDAPAMEVLDDGRILAIYTKHAVDGGGVYARISTNPEDITVWDAEQNLDSQIGGNRYTYPATFRLPNGKVRLFLRDTSLVGGETSRWVYTDITITGTSIAADAQTIFYSDSLKVAYMHVDFDGVDRFDIAMTDTTGAGTDMLHFYLTIGGGKFQTDGTVIAGALPLDKADVTLVHDGAAGGARYPASVRSVGGFPVITWPETTGGASDWYYARWDGATWTSHNVVSDGATGDAWVEGGFVLDQTDAAYAYLSRSSGGTYNVHRYHTADTGATWDSVQLATSPSDDFYPIAIRNPNRLRLLWLRGTASSFTSYSLGIMAA